MHFIIPFASVSSETAHKQRQALNLPHLRQLLDTLTLVDSDIGFEDSFSPPHERAIAKANGLPVADGYIPWAAQKASELGLNNATKDAHKDATSTVWSWVTLCHNYVGTGSMTMEDPASLQVTDAESRQLFQAMQPYFAEDGITLHYVEPSHWLASGEPLRDVGAASLDRVVGRDLDAWQPRGAQAGKLRRLQNEMQMLLYTHTVNDARNRAKAASINSIWLHGTGELLALQPKVSANIKVKINTPRTLIESALKEDWTAWVKAWEQLDATVCADLLKRLQAGELVVLTLCGERSALTYELRPKSALKRLKGSFRGIFDLKPAYLLSKQL
jgi:hypothetical protein